MLIIGVIFLLILYILSGYNKLIKFNKSCEFLKDKFDIKFNVNLDMKYYKLMMIGTILLLTLGSFILTYNIALNKNKFLTKILCLCFIIFTILATYIVHFPPKGKEYYQFLKNLSITGAFIILFYYN